MSPPTRPALSAGPSGTLTLSKITPWSVFTKSSTPMKDLTTGALAVSAVLLRIGLIRAVNAAAPTKNTSSATKIHAIPLMRRFLFGVTAALPVPAILRCSRTASRHSLPSRQRVEIRNSGKSEGQRASPNGSLNKSFDLQTRSWALRLLNPATLDNSPFLELGEEYTDRFLYAK